MSTKISDLAPEVAALALSAIQSMIERHVGHAVTSTLRTQAEQEALYAQGRKDLQKVNDLRKAAGMRPIAPSENRYTVTNADGVVHKSNHQSGRAIDIVPIDEKMNPEWPPASDVRWLMIATVMREFGFTWGGDWTRAKNGIDPDYPHYEYV